MKWVFGVCQWDGRGLEYAITHIRAYFLLLVALDLFLSLPRNLTIHNYKYWKDDPSLRACLDSQVISAHLNSSHYYSLLFSNFNSQISLLFTTHLITIHNPSQLISSHFQIQTSLYVTEHIERFGVRVNEIILFFILFN